MCDDCPVAQDCLEYALIYEEQGVWGGTTEKERDARFNEFYRERLVNEARRLGLYRRRLTSDEILRILRSYPGATRPLVRQ